MIQPSFPVQRTFDPKDLTPYANMMIITGGDYWYKVGKDGKMYSSNGIYGQDIELIAGIRDNLSLYEKLYECIIERKKGELEDLIWKNGVFITSGDNRTRFRIAASFKNRTGKIGFISSPIRRVIKKEEL